VTKSIWCSPIAYDLTRTSRRVSVPSDLELTVPEVPGAYAIYRQAHVDVCGTILDIGECGPRPKSKPHGLRGRLASGVAHSASEQMALDIRRGHIRNDLRVVWVEAETKKRAKEIQDALITLFRRECGEQPKYNTKPENHSNPESFVLIYAALKVAAGCKT